MARLAVIPSDPIKAYEDKGISSRLESYYNPLQSFDKVYLLSPYENERRHDYGMEIIPTKPRQFKKRLRDLKVDVVRAYGGYWACDLACYNKINNVPVVVSVHDTNPDLLHDSIAKADVVFCVSEAVKKLVISKFNNPEKVWLLPNRVDFDIMKPCLETEFGDLNDNYPYEHRVLHIGRKTEQKNLDSLIRALKILGDQYCIIAIGRGDDNQYIKLAEDLGVRDRCYFIQSVENKELARYYSWADCMCTPSRWEGFGVVFIEALASEAIVVTSDIAPMNEYIKHMSNGVLIKDYENPQSIADSIKVACCDLSLREAIKKAARNSIKRFDKNTIDKIEASYYGNIISMAKNGEFDRSILKKLFFKRRG